MKYLITLLQIVAAFCAVIIFNLPIASAVQISVFMPGSEDAKVLDSDVEPKVNVDIGTYHEPSDARWENVKVDITVVGTDPAYEVKKILLYRCKSLDPKDCVDKKEPVEANNYLSAEKGTFLWSDVSTGTTANFLTLVQMYYEGKNIWVGYWDTTEREDTQNFVKSRKIIDSISIHAKEGIDENWIFNFFTNYFMIPGDWVESINIETVDAGNVQSLQTIGGDSGHMEDGYFSSVSMGTNVISSFKNDYTFIFGGIGSMPLTVFSDTPSLCGDGQCDMLINENPQTCCLDCGCPEGDQECTVTDAYRNGMCHVCGDGIIDPVENSTNCCADAGCSDGFFCKEDRNVPYGICSTPNCGNGVCESPAETVANCCIDCGGSEACESSLGSEFYCNEDLEACTKPECGIRGCEPGEDVSNCCTDCGGNGACIGELGTGFYCNEDLNLCTGSSCNNEQCEPGEEYGGDVACCTDCNDCPVKSGNQLVCEQNVCHFCGNGIPEAPAETESNCCWDAGCSSDNDYCAESGSCMTGSSMSLVITASPQEVDCTNTDSGIPITLKIDVENEPFDFKGFSSAEYIYQGVSNKMDCFEKDNSYECTISTTNGDEDIFTGCFESGEVTFDINATVKYNRLDGKESSTREITGKAKVTVTKPLGESCNRKNGCETHLGESSVNCCYDCKCPSGLYCVEDSCREESAISLEVDEDSLPGADRIKCSLDNMVDDEYTFTARIVNRPDYYRDRMKVLSYSLSYDGVNYDPGEIDLNCESLKNEDGVFTGELECSMPLEYFPPCPFDPAHAPLTLHVNITGGGLEDAYGTGLELTDDFYADYEQGYQNCGNGEIDEPETSVTCCTDAGCPEGEYCALGEGCVDESAMGMEVSVLPSDQLDCSEPTGKTISFVAEISPKPVKRWMAGYEDIYRNETPLDLGIDCDFGMINGVESKHVLQCDFNMEYFLQCFDEGEETYKLNATVVYRNITGDERHVKLSEDVDVNVIKTMEPECVANDDCNPIMGEAIDKCCMDCGCTGTSFCTIDEVCNTSSVSLDVSAPFIGTGGSGSAIDCSEYNVETLDIVVENQPYNIEDIDFYAIADIGGFDQEVKLKSCDQGDSENEYLCEIYSKDVPYCYSEVAGSATKQLTITSRIKYDNKALQTYEYVNATRSVTINLKNLLGTCTNDYTGGEPGCQKDHGESSQTCCQDCGCDDFGGEGDDQFYVCTKAGCKLPETIKIELSPEEITAKCLIVPTKINWGDFDGLKFGTNFKDMTGQNIAEWECKVINEPSFEVNIVNEPADYRIIDGYYYIDGVKQCSNCLSEDYGSEGLEFKIRPDDIKQVSEIPWNEGSSVPEIEKRLMINLTILAENADGQATLLQLESKTIKLLFDTDKTDGLVSIEGKLENFKKSMKWWKAVMLIISGFSGVCAGCKTATTVSIINEGEVIFGFDEVIIETVSSLGTHIPLIISGVGLGASFINSIWVQIAGVFLVGVGFGALLLSFPPVGTAVCKGLEPVCPTFKVMLLLEGLILYGMTNGIKNLETDINKEMQAAETEVGESMEFYW